MGCFRAEGPTLPAGDLEKGTVSSGSSNTAIPWYFCPIPQVMLPPHPAQPQLYHCTGFISLLMVQQGQENITAFYEFEPNQGDVAGKVENSTHSVERK